MRRNLIFGLQCLSVLPLCLAVSAQVISSNQPAPQGPVSYSSVNQLNGLLAQLEKASQATQADLTNLRVDKWKIDSGSKRQTQGNVDSVQRNLLSALPEMIAELQTSPESLTATFKLYRNLDALYNVFGSVTESTGAFGSKDEFQSLENDLSEFEKARRAFADRMESLAGAKEAEVTHLRAALQSAQASINAEPPKKIVVDDDAPPKKPAKKKPVTKPKENPGQPPATQPQGSKPQ